MICVYAIVVLVAVVVIARIVSEFFDTGIL